MPWIEALLAFAVTMMILSTIVSVIIEAGHRLFRIREKGLRQLIQRLHEDTIAPLLPPQQRSPHNEFVRYMTSSGFTAGNSMVDRITNAGQLTSLSTQEFISRLAATSEGQALHDQKGQSSIDEQTYLRTMLSHITHRFDILGLGATDYFKRRASFYALVIGLLLALTCNINALELLHTYLLDNATHPILTDQSTAIDISTLGQPAAQKLAHLSDEGITFIVWFSNILLSGVLIGLGGPFWFDTYRKLGALAGLHNNGPQQAVNEPNTQDNIDEWLALFMESIRASQLRSEALG